MPEPDHVYRAGEDEGKMPGMHGQASRGPKVEEVD